MFIRVMHLFTSYHRYQFRFIQQSISLQIIQTEQKLQLLFLRPSHTDAQSMDKVSEIDTTSRLYVEFLEQAFTPQTLSGMYR